MRRWSPILITAMALGMAVPAMAGDGEEPYTVNYVYLVAQEGADQEKVEAAVDELAMKELNMHVNLIPMTIGTYESQIPVMMASGEDLDIVPVLNVFYASFVDAEYILDLNDYMEYAPDITALMGEDATAISMGDFLIGIPNMKERVFPTGLIVRKDIMDELGYSVEDFSVTTDDYSTYSQISDLFAAVKEKHPEMVCLDGIYSLGTQTDTFIDCMGNYYGVLEDYGQTTTVTNWFESDQYREFCNIARDWYQKGYLSQDIAVNSDTGEVKMKAGNCFSFISVTKPNTAQEKASQTGYEVEVISLSKSMKATNGLALLAHSIANASKNPEKAMEFLNWTYTSTEFMDLINWGIEGEHYVLTDDGLAAYPEGKDLGNVGYHNDFGWAYTNQFIGHPWEGNDPDIWEQYEAFNTSDDVITSEAFGFMFDATDYADQIAQLSSVYEQYHADLAFGVVDIDTVLEEFNSALYDAGLQDLIDAKQEQLDEWLANK